MKQKDRLAGSRVRKRSTTIDGHRTSVALEDDFWEALKEIASVRKLSINQLIADIDKQREHANLSSAIRLFAFRVYREELATLRKARKK